MFFVAKIFFTLSVFTTVFCEAYTPIVMWHGLADTCCLYPSQGKIASFIRKTLPGVYVLQLKIGITQLDDFVNSIVMHPDKQIEIACNIIQKDPLLANGYNAIGWSQGSQLMRGLAQRCPEPKMKTLITMSGQHQGVYGFPLCDPITKPFCDWLRQFINQFAYLRIVQKTFVPTTYWHNPLNKEAYLSGSTYLADINNEKYINQTYIKNLQLLENFVMVKYENDTGVIPKESSWFGFYKEGQSIQVESLYESELYITDRLGLKQMNEAGKLHLLSNDWQHTQFYEDWFKEYIIDKFLTN
ncbi:hypothetical protein ILUMI_18310 [Ignelater luminosus]|uniref:Palmitoyl-protein thioesterase 1 n=1 Tax=Ignelater luminosus TaxID=2038154 RepID=A0A8K0G711_IGNLU|nr:hypothetical protein ILUMI_18310 [Ignelater luminosus]